MKSFRAQKVFLWKWLLAMMLLLFFSSKGEPQKALPFENRLKALMDKKPQGSQVSVTVADASSGRILFAESPDLMLNPASNQKLLTAFAALSLLGPQMRFRTALFGQVQDQSVSPLIVRGHGDPTLRQSDLVELALELKRRGVARVDGIVVDSSHFAGPLLPPAFEQQPHEASAFRPAISAVAVDGNAYTLRIWPGKAEGESARIEVDGAAYFRIENQVKTGPKNGTPMIVADQRAEKEHMWLSVRGTIPLNSPPLFFRRRIEDPLRWTGHLLAEALERVGIRVSGTISVKGELDQSPSPPLLAMHLSQPLAQIIQAIGKHSDNFTAEMVFRAIGAERHRPARHEDSVQAIRELLRREGFSSEPKIVNGSGLYEGNLISSALITSILVRAFQEPSIRHEFLSHLAIAGTDGTLEKRLRDVPIRNVIRAKTGTLDDVIALSGYVLGQEAGRSLAFSAILNRVKGKHQEAKEFVDEIARICFEALWPQGQSPTP
ncbi:MAG: D-alanyl-D-alanine carboxypeptidase/D-alanyl-D-alanine-endopeptidase [Sandaracinaceae bacterium]|nr:D-alanyl-D-alanine carboxypeptidase/D-alanyl-D-alanine-endopeptidase [Sandaracinaceae bacterium]